MKLSTLEEFFDKLKAEEELEDEDIEIIKKSFNKSKIKFKTLMRTGEFAITEATLKEDGITQRGLRLAILEVIKTYHKNNIKSDSIFIIILKNFT